MNLNLVNLANKKSYALIIGWLTHAIYLNFLNVDDNILLSICNPGAGSKSHESNDYFIQPLHIATVPINEITSKVLVKYVTELLINKGKPNTDDTVRKIIYESSFLEQFKSHSLTKFAENAPKLQQKKQIALNCVYVSLMSGFEIRAHINGCIGYINNSFCKQ